jgi:hypothetical protein
VKVASRVEEEVVRRVEEEVARRVSAALASEPVQNEIRARLKGITSLGLGFKV